MDINRCKLCKNYNSFFSACKLDTEEVYYGDGDSDEYPVSINEVSDEECIYEPL